MAERNPASLLAAYRDAAGPSPLIEQRMLDGLHAQLAQPASGGDGGATSAASSGAATAGSVKLAVVFAVVGGVIAASPWLRSVVEPGPPPAAVIAIEADPPIAVIEPTPAPVVPSAVPSRAPRDRVEPARTGSRHRSAARARTAAAPAPTLADEALLLRAADTALRQGRLSEARSLLDRHALEFGHASLQAEAALLELLLACAERDPGAQARAMAWLERQPSHPARARIVELCQAAQP